MRRLVTLLWLGLLLFAMALPASALLVALWRARRPALAQEAMVAPGATAALES